MTGRRGWPVALAALALALVAVIAAFAAGSDPVEQWRLAARWTARVGFPVFILTYSASSLARLWPGTGTRALVRDRRWWGLGFAGTHTVHLVALLGFLRVSGTTPSAVTVVGGGLGYALLYAMALTSNRTAVNALGPAWKWLHRAGIHWLWVVFASSYIGRIFEPASAAIGWLFGSIALAALGLRLAAAWVRRRERLSRSPTAPAARRTA